MLRFKRNPDNPVIEGKEEALGYDEIRIDPKDNLQLNSSGQFYVECLVVRNGKETITANALCDIELDIANGWLVRG